MGHAKLFLALRWHRSFGGSIAAISGAPPAATAAAAVAALQYLCCGAAVLLFSVDYSVQMRNKNLHCGLYKTCLVIQLMGAGFVNFALRIWSPLLISKTTSEKIALYQKGLLHCRRYVFMTSVPFLFSLPSFIRSSKKTCEICAAIKWECGDNFTSQQKNAISMKLKNAFVGCFHLRSCDDIIGF